MFNSTDKKILLSNFSASLSSLPWFPVILKKIFFFFFKMGQSKKRQTHVCQNSDSTDMANWITIDVIKVFRWRIIGGIISCIFDVLAIYLSSLFLDVWSYVLVFSACLEAKLSRPAQFSGQLHFYWFRVMCGFFWLPFLSF